jgi:hypothetical protein
MLPTPTATESKAEKVVDPGWASYRKGARLTTAVLFLPTPTVGDAAASGSRCHEGSSAHPGVSLTDVVVHGRTLDVHGPRTTGGRLEPRFVEWLMGLPLRWTEPDFELVISDNAVVPQCAEVVGYVIRELAGF